MADLCDEEELCEECPEWIFTLADLLMCMMGLFVILWVLKPDVAEGATAEEQKVQEQIDLLTITSEIRRGFGESDAELAESEMKLMELAEQLRMLRGPGERGVSKNRAEGAEGTDPEVQKLREGEIIGKGGRIEFAAAGTKLGPEERETLAEIAAKIRGHRNLILVKGHTSSDDLPESAEAENHMRLSFQRASVVAEYLVTQGVSPDILRLQACGDFEPVRLRAYDAGDRRTNRRVEVEATDQLVEARQDAAAEIPVQE